MTCYLCGVMLDCPHGCVICCDVACSQCVGSCEPIVREGKREFTILESRDGRIHTVHRADEIARWRAEGEEDVGRPVFDAHTELRLVCEGASRAQLAAVLDYIHSGSVSAPEDTAEEDVTATVEGRLDQLIEQLGLLVS